MNLSDRPIFIVGAPRSGTTLMRQIVDAHPNIFCPPWEIGIFDHLAPMLNGDLRLVGEDPSFPLTRSVVIDWVRRSVVDLLRIFAEKADKIRWAEKTPAHVYHIALIQEVFPHAQFIHMIRNGYEVVRSLQSMPWAPRSILWCVDRWKTSVQQGRAAGKVLPESQYFEVRYEDLIHQPEATVRGLAEFLGEPFDTRMLEFHKKRNNSWNTELMPLQSTPVCNHPDLGLIKRLLFRLRAKSLMYELGYHL